MTTVSETLCHPSTKNTKIKQNKIKKKKKKKLPSKLLIEKFEKKRNEDKILYEIYHNHSMKFLKPLKNSFTKIPQTNIINQGK